jgi:Fungal chitosanase of glycosyl hydrolase group 75
VAESPDERVQQLEESVRELRLKLESFSRTDDPADSPAKSDGVTKKEVSPLMLTIFGGIVTGIFAIANSFSQAKQAHQLEEDKLRSTLILKAIEPSNPDERKKALLFYVETGLLSDPGGKIGRIKPQDIPQAPESSRAFAGGASYSHIKGKGVLHCGFIIDVDGSPHAYHPDGHSGLDVTANAGSREQWYAVVTDNGSPAGKPIVQGPGDPAPGYYVSNTALQDTSKARTDPRRFVDSEIIPYIVLPAGIVGRAGEPKLGDLAAVFNERNGKLSYAIVADIGSRRHLGEGSIALAARLGLPSNPRSGGVGSGIAMVVFPGSGDGHPKTAEEIDRKGAEQFESWCGLKSADASQPSSVTPSPSQLENDSTINED